MSLTPTGREGIDFTTALYNIQAGPRESGSKCIPFISQYTDCTDENACTGCNRCHCNADSQWVCSHIVKCTQDIQDKPVDSQALDNAIKEISNDVAQNLGEAYGEGSISLSQKYTPKDDLLEVEEDEVLSLIRKKRSAVDDVKNEADPFNEGVKYYNAPTELRDDISSKLTNKSGILMARKINAIPKVSRRTGKLLDNLNVSSDPGAFQIKYNEQPKDVEIQAVERKMDTISNITKANEILSRNKINELMKNHTIKDKDSDVSKLVVHELKKGTELVGDKNAPVISNIKFTPENETVAAIALIAGNLLNQLWAMEKDNGDDSDEIKTLKYEKINSLLDLFREPLSVRQEQFLKEALEKIYEAINKTDNIDKVSLCEIEAQIKARSTTQKPVKMLALEDSISKPKVNEKKVNKTGSNIIALVRKFAKVQSDIAKMTGSESESTKREHKAGETPDSGEKVFASQFGSVLQKITKFLMPNDNRKKQMLKRLHDEDSLKSDDVLKVKLKAFQNIDLDELTLTAKDRALMQYLSKVEKEPCLTRAAAREPFRQKDSYILNTLVNLFNVKSINDIVNLVQQRLTDSAPVRTTMKPYDDVLQLIHKPAFSIAPHNRNEDAQLHKAKQRLKNHLKDVINDLAEMQNATNIKITDILPCLDKIMNEDKLSLPPTQNSNGNTNGKAVTIQKLLNAVKVEPKIFMRTRKFNSAFEERPKSASVWERATRLLSEARKAKTRRVNDESTPKSYPEIIKNIKNFRFASLKRAAESQKLEPHERLVAYKALLLESSNLNSILNEIVDYVEMASALPTSQLKELLTFMQNVIALLNANERALKQAVFRNKASVLPVPMKPSASLKFNKLRSNDKVEDSIAKAIRSKVQTFIDEAEKYHLDTDYRYSAAKDIIKYIDGGSINIAKDLFKSLMSEASKNDGDTKESQNRRLFRSPTKRSLPEISRRSDQIPLNPFPDEIRLLRSEIVDEPMLHSD